MSDIKPNSDNSSTEKKVTRYILSDESFALLRESQEEIFIATGVTPSIRMLVNSVISQENVAQITQRLIESLKI